MVIGADIEEEELMKGSVRTGLDFLPSVSENTARASGWGWGRTASRERVTRCIKPCFKAGAIQFHTVYLLTPEFGRQRQVDLCELKPSLLYTVSSRKARATQRDLVLKQNKTKQNKPPYLYTTEGTLDNNSEGSEPSIQVSISGDPYLIALGCA
jgi:hypothetical protein